MMLHYRRSRIVLLASLLATTIWLGYLLWNSHSQPIENPENFTRRIRPVAFAPNQFDTKAEEIRRLKDVRGVEIRTLEGFNNIELPSTFPDYQPFDARFTFAILLHYLEKYEHDELPGFHWADFTSMEPLEKYLFSVKMSCSDFDIRTHNASRDTKEDRRNPNRYCIDDTNIPKLLETSKDEELVKSLKYIQQQKYSTGFHMFTNCGRQSFEFRSIIGRSYLYEFMPPPQSLILLFPEFKAFQIDINQDKKLKLIQYADVIERSINVKDQLTKFMKTLPIKANPIPYSIELNHEEFIDKSPEIMQTLNDSEEPLSERDQAYLEGLKYSSAIKWPSKYFSEALILKSQRGFSAGSHYDWRFYNGNVVNSPKNDMSIHGLLKAMFKLANAYDIKCWIAHGSLLSWYWDGMKFPWDSDVDITMPIDELHKLARLFNQSLIVDFGNDIDSQIRYGRYFFDSSTFISRRTMENGRNVIDARLIDIDTGIYIDITGLAITTAKAPERYDFLLKSTKYERDSERNLKDKSVAENDTNTFLQAYNCKNHQFFRLKELSPLMLSLFDGEFTYVPNQISRILMNKFSPKSIINTQYKDYTYVPILRLWLKTEVLYDFLAATTKRTKKAMKDKKVVPELNEEQCLELLKRKKDILVEYLRTRRLTAFHDEEVRMILQDESTESLNYEDGTLIDNTAVFRPDMFTSTNRITYDKAWKRVNKLLKEYEKKGKKAVKVILGPDVIPGAKANGNEKNTKPGSPKVSTDKDKAASANIANQQPTKEHQQPIKIDGNLENNKANEARQNIEEKRNVRAPHPPANPAAKMQQPIGLKQERTKTDAASKSDLDNKAIEAGNQIGEKTKSRVHPSSGPRVKQPVKAGQRPMKFDPDMKNAKRAFEGLQRMEHRTNPRFPGIPRVPLPPPTEEELRKRRIDRDEQIMKANSAYAQRRKEDSVNPFERAKQVNQQKKLDKFEDKDAKSGEQKVRLVAPKAEARHSGKVVSSS
ncbi:uncharacterized protein J8A68_000887 [[Candida] subhashii]|uniref:LicD/FKTN/FKRP nucleotidyltransferase domain-containing protein n=1 Tax=[Candida] subhashii TaxID=561895 RepID=A0A8J5R5A1_9ASCO|nr:uncharacterized protein J8A68_000887 [[Candida] subhashii]KAG7665485.1 hypothetical protein J8A68_000887 [[Candida] subhashii]